MDWGTTADWALRGITLLVGIIALMINAWMKSLHLPDTVIKW